MPNLLLLSTTNDSHIYRLFQKWMVRIYWARLYQSIGHLLLKTVHVGEVEAAIVDGLKAPPPPMMLHNNNLSKSCLTYLK